MVESIVISVKKYVMNLNFNEISKRDVCRFQLGNKNLITLNNNNLDYIYYHAQYGLVG